MTTNDKNPSEYGKSIDGVDLDKNYYMKAFRKLEKEHKNTWNWSASIFLWYWMLYRKMPLYAFINAMSILGVLLGLCVITENFGSLLTERTILICFAITWTIYFTLNGLFANAVYYRIVKKRIRKGYHVMPYRPVTWFCLANLLTVAIYDLVDIIVNKFFRTKNKNFDKKITEENIKQYLSCDRDNHPYGLIVCWGLFISLVILARFIK